MADKRKKLLLVDDEPDILAVMAAILRNGGYDVIQARSGEEALSLAEAQKPDLILLDIKMPGMDGVKTTDALKNNPKTKNIPIAYLTNLVEEDEVLDGHVLGSRIGGLYFIPKTYGSEKILELVKENLEAAGKGRKA
ncbi:MAG: response regulator [Candidatus Omnitrophota bacterium]